MARVIEMGGEPVNASEREMVNLLVERLPDAYWVVPNVTLSQRGHPYEYDAVVVAPHAVHVVETKGWNGTITALSRGQWQLSNGRVVSNPLDLTTRKAKILASAFNDLTLETPSGEHLRTPYVQASLLCSGDDVVYDVDPDIRHQCLTPGGATAYLMDADRINVSVDRSKYRHCTEEIAEHVAGKLRGREPKPPRYGNYRAVEPVEDRDDAKIYLAEHAELDDKRVYRVRIWFLSPYSLEPEEREKRIDQLRRSAEALSRIGHHENLATIVDFGSQEGEFHEVTEWSEQGTLGTAISRGSTLQMSVARRLQLLAGIARGLEAASDEGVTHRSLTPETILLNPGGSPQLVDFDLARLPDSSETIYGEAVDDMVQSEYVAPELQSSRDYEVHESSDLYSLGIIAFELFTSMLPSMVGGWTPAKDQMMSALSETPQELDDELVELVTRLRAEDPDERPDDAGDVAEDFERMVDALERDSEARVTSPGTRDESIDPADLEPGDWIDDSNRVVEFLREGEDAVVYAVENDVLGGEFALKAARRTEGSDPEAPIRVFQRLREVEHPSLVRVHWAGRIGSGDEAPGYLLMDRLDGETLAVRLEREGAFEPEHAVEWILDLLDAIAEIHPTEERQETGLLHRDIKPENLVVEEDRLVLVDFDSSTEFVLGVDPDAAGDAPVGTLRYTPPDLSDGGWDRSCDLFAVGCVLYEMLASRPPWVGTAPSAERPADPLGSVCADGPESLADVVDRAIDPERAERFETAGEFAEALESHADRRKTQVVAGPDVEHALDSARDSVWSGDFLDALGNREEVLSMLMGEVRDWAYRSVLPVSGELHEAFVEAEARATALERPMPEIYFGLYDELAQRNRPRLVDTEADAEAIEPNRLELEDDDVLVVADGLHLFETTRVARTVEHEDGEVDWWVWTAGPTDLRRGQEHLPFDAGEREDPSETAFVEPGSGYRVNWDSEGRSVAEYDGEEGPLRLEVEMPAGHRGDAGLPRLLERRWRMLSRLLDEVRASERRVWLTVRYGSIYLGHGLRDDIGGGLDERVDSVRARWAGAFPGGRVGEPDGDLPNGECAKPWRDAEGLRFPVGRIAWPDPPDALRLQYGGLSLSERLLPLLRFH
jgi:serine/threonine protein kinase